MRSSFLEELIMGTRYIHRPDAAKPWRAEWYDYFSRPGKRVRGGTRTFETPGAADRWIEQQESANAAYWGREGTGRARSVARTFGPFATGWVNHQPHLARTTRNNRRSQIRQLIAHFGEGTPLVSISREDVRGYVAHLTFTREVGAGTVRGLMAALRGIMASALDAGVITHDPTRGVDLPRYHNRRAPIVRQSQVADLIEHMPARLRAAVALAWATGLRIGEVAGLRTDAVDLDRRRITVAHVRHGDGTTQDHGKSGKSDDYVVMPIETTEVLRAHMAEFPPSPDGYVFTLPAHGRHGGHRGISQGSLRGYFKAACRAAGIAENVRFHDLRHSCAKSLAEKNAPAFIIQRQLRHGSLATSQRYIGTVSDDQLSHWVDQPEARPLRAVPAA